MPEDKSKLIDDLARLALNVKRVREAAAAQRQAATVNEPEPAQRPAAPLVPGAAPSRQAQR